MIGGKLKCEDKVNPRLDDKRARSSFIIGKVGWKGGKEKNFKAYT